MSDACGMAVKGSSGLSAGRSWVVWCVGLALGVGASQIVSRCRRVWVWPVFDRGGISEFSTLDSL